MDRRNSQRCRFRKESIVPLRDLFACMTLLLMPSCAPIQKYRPAPLSPAETASRLVARSLEDSGLRRFVEQSLNQQLSPWPPNSWDLRLLTLAAFYFNPALDAA